MRLAALFLFSLLPTLAQKPSVIGYWEGALSTPAGKLRLGVHVSQGADGLLSGKLDSIDQGAFGLALQDVAFDGGVFKFALKVAGASFQGNLNDSGTEIGGTFTQGGDLPLVLKKTEKAPEAVKHPQVPTKPYPYREEDVTFENKTAPGVTLAGTLTLPQGKGPFPAVILITGSGPQDRDESLMGHKPFLVLSDHLTRQGIAVLRYDDRGVGKSTGKFGEGTTEDFAGDASAAVDYLKTRTELDAKRIGLVGHSEGGMIAPMVAVKRSDVAFVVLMAGTAVPGEQVIYEQGKAILKAQGATEEIITRQKNQQQAIFAAVKEGKDPEDTAVRVKKVVGESPQADAQLKSVNTPWFRFFLSYDPAPTLAKVKAPLLAMNGELDLQVLPDQNLPVLEAALKQGGNKDYNIARLPKLNHLFQTATTGSPREYAQIEETMAPLAMETMSKWIRAHTGIQ